MCSDDVPKETRGPVRVLLAIGGGTCSGKTTLAHALARSFSQGGASVLATDCYYRDLPHLPPAERARQNFDHPDAIDWPLLENHVALLMRGDAVLVPRYDFSAHARMTDSEQMVPTGVLIVEGLLALHSDFIRDRARLRIYMDVPDEIALARRIARDVRERGRTPESVHDQFRATVRPMADQFVTPTRAHADLVLRCDMPIENAVAAVVSRLPEALIS